MLEKKHAQAEVDLENMIEELKVRTQCSSLSSVFLFCYFYVLVPFYV